MNWKDRHITKRKTITQLMGLLVWSMHSLKPSPRAPYHGFLLRLRIAWIIAISFIRKGMRVVFLEKENYSSVSKGLSWHHMFWNNSERVALCCAFLNFVTSFLPYPNTPKYGRIKVLPGTDLKRKTHRRIFSSCRRERGFEDISSF